MSLFRHSFPLGLSCTDATCRIVSIAHGGKRVRIAGRAERPLPPGLLEGGAVRDAPALAHTMEEALRSMRSARGQKSVALCLPVENVYTSLVTLPPHKEEERDELIRNAEVQERIPEPKADMQIFSTVLSQSKTDVALGIAAVRRDLLQGYADALQLQLLQMSHVTSTSMALHALLEESQRGEGPPFLLLDAGAPIPYVSLFHKSWPIDECLLNLREKPEAWMVYIEKMRRYHREHGIAAERLVVLGTPETVECIRKTCGKDIAAEAARLRLEKADDLVWAPATGASLHSIV